MIGGKASEPVYAAEITPRVILDCLSPRSGLTLGSNRDVLLFEMLGSQYNSKMASVDLGGLEEWRSVERMDLATGLIFHSVQTSSETRSPTSALSSWTRIGRS